MGGGLREELVEPDDEKCHLTEQMTREREEPGVLAQGGEEWLHVIHLR